MARKKVTYYVYVLRSSFDRGYYCGQTSDLKRRLAEHNAGRVPSTARRAPFELVYWEEFKTRGEAMRRERKLKRLGRKEKRALIRGVVWRLEPGGTD